MQDEQEKKTLSDIEACEKMYPQTTSEFKKILKEEYALFCKKQLNYGPHNISVGTPLSNESEIKLSLTGLFFRMNDKIQRIKQLIVMGTHDSVGETVDDTFQDLSVYGVIAQIVKRGKWGK
jgi:flavodoxin